MYYKEFPWINKTFVVVAWEGVGVMESRPSEKGPVFASDNFEEALSKGNELFPKDADVWTYYNFQIAVNTSTTEGRRLLEVFQNDFKEMEKKIKENPGYYDVYKLPEDSSITFMKNPILDGKSI